MQAQPSSGAFNVLEMFWISMSRMIKVSIEERRTRKNFLRRAQGHVRGPEFAYQNADVLPSFFPVHFLSHSPLLFPNLFDRKVASPLHSPF